ncbi:hypothetical protein HWV62_16596 [Athelia sp. TMB]|nr:hypothetical protein HWV62_16596 [Athelia sp. TMB]
MVNFNSLTSAILLSFAVSALASPVARNSFMTHPITKKASKSITAILAKDKARLAKYNGHVPLAEDNFAVSGSTPVINEVNSYIAQVHVGSQTFDLIVDTGSSNTWVGASTKFSNGSTGVSTGQSVSVSYGSGYFEGTEYTDTVNLGSAKVISQSIGVASMATGFNGVDGIIGFGPVGLTENTVSGMSTVPTFMDNLHSKGTIPTEVLGVSFAPESGSDYHDANGELTFGGIDSTKYSGSITYAARSSSSSVGPYWGVAVSAIKYGSTSLGSGSGVVDTGTTLIYIPTSAYMKFLSASGGKTDPNTGLAKFTKKPTGIFSFTIAGKLLNLTPAQYLIPTAQLRNFGLPSSAYYSWINDGGSYGVDFIIGQKFLENYYSIFDTTKNRIGFATAA